MTKQIRTLEELSVTYPKYVVTLKEFKFSPQNQIGIGSSFTVYKGIHRTTKQDVAIKFFNTKQLEDSQLLSYCLEVQIFITCDNPFILPFIGFSNAYPFILVTPFCAKGDLFSHLYNEVYDPLSPTQKNLIAMGIANGMSRCHELNVIHRDLKSLNILLDDDYLPKICDFGVSRFITKSTDPLTQYIGTAQWTAPEIYQTSTYNNKVDVYSFGMILYELVTDLPPFYKDPPNDIPRLILQEHRPRLKKTVPPNLSMLIEACWNQDPNQRPTFYQIYKLFESKRVIFNGADKSAIDQLVERINSSAGQQFTNLVGASIGVKQSPPQSPSQSPPNNQNSDQNVLQNL